HEALTKAAGATKGILTEPRPFVLQTSLDDSYVSYELNAYTDKPNEMALIYSELHQNVQDSCNEVGIEILSPAYGAIRDGNRSTIPAEHLAKDYQAPAFRVRTDGQH
ncbi:MAG TPA: mechanosensitive ion channel family protein, partial [Anaerolineae bacterium]|nr:mechanosensitive ion channel family protein [Anaerolineae bacterium]